MLKSGELELMAGPEPRIKIAEKKLTQVNDTEDSKYLNQIIKHIKCGQNVFVTGYAGTGKSYILNKLKSKYKNLQITSTTGLAAVNVKGQTVHSWTGVGICNKPIDLVVKNILKKTSLRKKLQNTKLLAIDEISMLDSSNFEYIDKVLRLVRDVDEPFGGIQLLLFGDFYQLPPVAINKETAYCFESNYWDDFHFKTVFLEKIYRQKDIRLIKALNNIRLNNLTQEDIELFRLREIDISTSSDEILHIFGTNNEANKYNKIKFNELEGNPLVYNAIDGIYRGEKFIKASEGLKESELISLNNLRKNCNADDYIELKIGCRVMLLINQDFEKGLINGSCGEIVELKEDEIRVKFDNGQLETIARNDFEYYWNDKLVAARKQFPLKLAYGLTIHKSQGMTLEKLVVDCNRIFETGQAYVALSRIKSLEGLYLKSFSPEKVLVDEKVVNFYKSLIN